MIKTSEELTNLTTFLTYCESRKECFFQVQEHEKAARYKDLIRSVLEMIHHISGDCLEIKSNAEQEKEIHEKIVETVKTGVQYESE
jgi:2-succinyl-5-enolpyruvyl-6-hydroxy-3-cyclohexene-1-carboxylate synthase